MSVSALMNGVAAPLDRARAVVLRATARPLRHVIVDRERRVAVFATASMLVTVALTLTVPLWLLALGPIVWGVPHLFADVRYLVVRPGLHRRASAWLLIGVPVAIAGVTQLGVRAGAFAVIGAVLLAREVSIARRSAAFAGAAALVAVAWRLGRMTDLVMAHAHNFVAVALWFAWRSRGRKLHWIPVVLFVAMNVACVSGMLDPIVAALGGFASGPADLPLGRHMMSLAPMPEHIDLSRRLVLAFAFAQSVHYFVWLRMVPDDARGSKTPRSFRQTFAAIRAELGTWLPVAFLMASVALAVWAVADLVAARAGYLRFALFHGHLEIAMAALWLLEGRRPVDACDGSRA